MSTEILQLLSKLRGRAYNLFCCLKTTGNFDIRLVTESCRLMPFTTRRAVKRRLKSLLLRRQLGHLSRQQFVAAWRRMKTTQRREELARLHSTLGSPRPNIYRLLSAVLTDGMISGSDFAYIWRPVPEDPARRIVLYWWACLKHGCHSINVIRLGTSSVVEIRLTPLDPLSYLF